MRIGLFSDTFPPDINGVANSTSILYRELTEHGHDVYVVATYNGLMGYEWDETGHILRLAGVKLKFLYGYNLTGPIHEEALREIEKLHLDIIHVQTEFGVGMFARICARRLDIPIVSTYHTTYEDYTHYLNFLHSEILDGWMKKGVAIASRLVGDSTDEVITPSEKTKELLEGYRVSREIEVIPTGLPLDSFSPDLLNPELYTEIRREFGFSEKDRVIIYVGRLAEEKALDLVIRGFAEADKRKIPVKLLIVGGGPDFGHLQEMAEQLGISDMVRLAGPRPANQVPDFYRAANAFVSASLSETQGMTFIEALASGLPLFARRDEVLADLLIDGETGWYFSSPEDFADRLEQFVRLSDAELSAISQRCVQQVKPYSSEIFFQNIIQVYERVIRAHTESVTVTKTALKDTYVDVTVEDSSHRETGYQISLDDYDAQNLKVGMKLNGTAVQKLHSLSLIARTYQRCIRKLAAKDRSEAEMRTWIKENTECGAEQTDTVIGRLKKHGYIDDERYCESTVRSMSASLHGPRRIHDDLKKKGIDESLIEKNLDEISGQQPDHAMQYARKVMRTHEGGSVRRLISTLRTKLLQQGYEGAMIDRVISEIDFAGIEEKETENLRAAAAKAVRHYKRKYAGNELKKRVYASCAQQGYDHEDIQKVMEETEWNDGQN